MYNSILGALGGGVDMLEQSVLPQNTLAMQRLTLF